MDTAQVQTTTIYFLGRPLSCHMSDVRRGCDAAIFMVDGTSAAILRTADPLPEPDPCPCSFCEGTFCAVATAAFFAFCSSSQATLASQHVQGDHQPQQQLEPRKPSSWHLLIRQRSTHGGVLVICGWSFPYLSKLTVPLWEPREAA